MNKQEMSVQLALEALKLAVKLHEDHYDSFDTQPFTELLDEIEASNWQSSSCYN